MSTRRPRAATTVFDSDLLDRLPRGDRGGPTVAEAEHAGPWTVQAQESGFAVLREADDEADARLAERETALLLAAVFPALGREPRYQLVTKEGAAGVDVRSFGGGRLEKVGWLRHRHPEIVEALHVVEWLLRSPASLALLLEAASYEVLAHAGRILDRRLSTEERA